MKKRVSLLCAFLISTAALAEGGHHWGYSGEGNPEHWAQLSPDFAMCNGQNQSPIDLTGFIEADLAPLTFHYSAGGQQILNNGHTIQVNYAPGSELQLDGKTFTLKQFHFHAPSENHINGRSFPLEAHLVHADAEGNLAVVAVMFDIGAENPVLQQAFSQMPMLSGGTDALKQVVDASNLLPQNKDYYRFNGSLTTPPCTEGVRWLVMKNPMTASGWQVEQFAYAMQHPNNRPIQAQHARMILQ